MMFFFNDTATTEIYTLSLHDALPIFPGPADRAEQTVARRRGPPAARRAGRRGGARRLRGDRAGVGFPGLAAGGHRPDGLPGVPSADVGVSAAQPGRLSRPTPHPVLVSGARAAVR